MSAGALAPLAVRSAFGGALMGLANLVPGISGGTMLLAAGIYPRFIRAIAEVTTLRFRLSSVVVLGCVGVAAVLAIVLLAGWVKGLVVDHRWVMYSLFIGLTLGGVPLVWGMAFPGGRSGGRSVWIGAVVGLLVMVGIALVQQGGAGGGAGAGSGFVMLMVAGMAGASAMILPGVSGGYLLLVLGQYVPILASIDRLKDAISARDIAAATAEWVVVAPVGIGVVAGIVGVSNLLRVLLQRHEKATLGVLLGLLVGAVVGLWPFQRGVEPRGGDVVKGVVLTADDARLVEPEDWRTEYFAPTVGQVAGAAGLVVMGFGATLVVARLGREKRGVGGGAGGARDESAKV